MSKTKQFDEAEVLTLIAEHFWEHGYIATTVDALAEITSLTKSSIYNAFGNKESLFIKAVDVYVSQIIAGEIKDIDRKKTMSENLEHLLELSFLSGNNKKLAYGCLLTNSILELAGNNENLYHEASVQYDKVRQEIRKIFKHYVDNKKVIPNIGADDLTDLFTTFLHGLRVQSRDNHPDVTLKRSIRTFINLVKTIELN